MMIEKNALLITDVTSLVDGWQLRCATVPVTVLDSETVADRMFDNNGNELCVETIQSQSKIGDVERINEEALSQSLVYVSSAQCSSPPCSLSWLFPIKTLEVDSCKCSVKVSDFNLFKSAGLQLASWNRFIWGNLFFDDPSTPKEHTSRAVEQMLQVGDAIPVRINDAINGVLILGFESAKNEFESTIYTIGKCDIENGSLVETVTEMTVEGISASFKSKLGLVTSVHATCSN